MRACSGSCAALSGSGWRVRRSRSCSARVRPSVSFSSGLRKCTDQHRPPSRPQPAPLLAPVALAVPHDQAPRAQTLVPNVRDAPILYLLRGSSQRNASIDRARHPLGGLPLLPGRHLARVGRPAVCPPRRGRARLARVPLDAGRARPRCGPAGAEVGRAGRYEAGGRVWDREHRGERQCVASLPSLSCSAHFFLLPSVALSDVGAVKRTC